MTVIDSGLRRPTTDDNSEINRWGVLTVDP